jgi:hypothetical protein
MNLVQLANFKYFLKKKKYNVIFTEIIFKLIKLLYNYLIAKVIYAK